MIESIRSRIQPLAFRRKAVAVGWANAQDRRSIGADCLAHLPTRKSLTRPAADHSPKAPRDVANIATPVGRQQPARDITVKAAIGPVADPGGLSMLCRIAMNVIDMSSEVRVVADGVLPVAALPNSLFALSDLAGATPRNAG